MIFFSIILYILWDVILCVCALLFLQPVLTALFAIVAVISIVNIILKVKKGKIEITPWNLFTVGITAMAGLSFWNEIAHKISGSGMFPIITFLICVLILISAYKTRKARNPSPKSREVVPFEQLSESVKKRIRTIRIVAIICTVMACIGALIVITESSEIGEALPPTIVFAAVAIICWAIAGKKS